MKKLLLSLAVAASVCSLLADEAKTTASDKTATPSCCSKAKASAEAKSSECPMARATCSGCSAKSAKETVSKPLLSPKAMGELAANLR